MYDLVKSFIGEVNTVFEACYLSLVFVALIVCIALLLNIIVFVIHRILRG